MELLRQVWIQQYVVIEGQLVWRSAQETGMPKHSHLIVSPYDTEARNASKRQTNWTGYKVHLTESCDQKLPHLIINVEKLKLFGKGQHQKSEGKIFENG